MAWSRSRSRSRSSRSSRSRRSRRSWTSVVPTDPNADISERRRLRKRGKPGEGQTTTGVRTQLKTPMCIIVRKIRKELRFGRFFLPCCEDADVHHRSQNSKRASFLPIFLAMLRSRHCVPAKLPLVADKNEKVAANVPPARCFLQLRRGIPRGVAALRRHTHRTGGGAGLARNFQQRHQFHQNEYCHVKKHYTTQTE